MNSEIKQLMKKDQAIRALKAELAAANLEIRKLKRDLEAYQGQAFEQKAHGR